MQQQDKHASTTTEGLCLLRLCSVLSSSPHRHVNPLLGEFPQGQILGGHSVVGLCCGGVVLRNPFLGNGLVDMLLCRQ
jgi:hypothetical protein